MFPSAPAVTAVTRSPITEVNFTWALPGGLWIRRGTTSAEWISGPHLVAEVGDVEAARLTHVAHHNGWTGMWYPAQPQPRPQTQPPTLCEFPGKTHISF